MTTFSQIAAQLEGQAIELPSWAFGNSGTRFKVFGTAGTPRSIQEKIADAATVHRFTGLAPAVALHIPWDLVDDCGRACAPTPRATASRSARSTPTPSRTTTTSSAR